MAQAELYRMFYLGVWARISNLDKAQVLKPSGGGCWASAFHARVPVGWDMFGLGRNSDIGGWVSYVTSPGVLRN